MLYSFHPFQWGASLVLIAGNEKHYSEVGSEQCLFGNSQSKLQKKLSHPTLPMRIYCSVSQNTLESLLLTQKLTSPPKGERAVKGSFLTEGNLLI